MLCILLHGVSGPRQIHLNSIGCGLFDSWLGEAGHTNMSILYTHTYIYGRCRPGCDPVPSR